MISPAWIIGLDAATFAVLALQTGRTSLPAASTPVPAAGDTRHGLSILRRQPDLLALLVVTWLFNLAFGPVEVALPLFVTDDLHAGPGLLGQYWAAFGIGAVIGALALGVARRLPLWPAMLAIIAGHGIGMLPFAVHPHRRPLPDRLRVRRPRLRPLLRTLLHGAPGPGARRVADHRDHAAPRISVVARFGRVG